MIMVIIMIITSSWAISVLINGETISRLFFLDFWDKRPEFLIDRLSAFFMLVINFSLLTGTIYAYGYLKPYMHTKTGMHLSIHFFSLVWLHTSMLQVTMLREGMEFLLVWELMALSSFLLVIFYADKKEVLNAGINYLIQMHIGFGAILIGFLIIQRTTGIMSFDALESYFSTENNFLLFLIFFIGFGIKAGFMPFHTWLPRAHPAAPTHVSAIMSGVIIKIGIYGILRVLMYVQSSFLEIAMLILIVSVISGLMGVILAIFQHDLKKLLAYHSIENIGIIGIGIGAAILGKYFDNANLIFLGLGGALLHTLNHSLFKSSLFYSAGSVLQATGTKNIEKLGGIIKAMPVTSLIFLFSALAICGLPPFNGFISEFVIYSGIFQNLTHAGFANSLVSIGVIVSLALIGGLALFCFTKAFGIAFLGMARSKYYQQFSERPMSMTLPGIVILIVIICIGFFPSYFFQVVNSVSTDFGFTTGYASPTVINHALSQVGIINFIFAGVVVSLILLRYVHQKNSKVVFGPTWGCGYTAADFKHQYTSTSYADNIRQIVGPLISYKRDYKSFPKDELFPQSKEFSTHGEDKIEINLILKPVHWLITALPKAGLAQTGSIHHYLLYPVMFMILIGILTYFQFI